MAARFVTLISWTEQGVQSYQGTVDRAEAAADMARQMGGTLESVFWTLGPYDIVTVAQFPDPETATAYALRVASQGNVRTTTMRAFNADEMREIIAKAGG